MAKIILPLLSENASGSIGPELTFSQRKTGQQVRFQRKQKDVITPARTAQRAKFLQGLLLWNSLTETEKGYWKTVEKYGYIDI